MAQKVGNKKAPRKSAAAGKPAAASSADGAAQDQAELSVLHPEGKAVIGGRAVVVREYGYIEGMQLQPALRPFLQALYQARAREGAPPNAEDVADVIAMHLVTVQWLMAQAITPIDEEDPQAFLDAVAENAKWIAGLNDVAGELLMTLWWGTNAGFFIRRLRRLALAAVEERAASLAGASASASSTAP